MGNRLEKIIIPIVSDKERAGEYCINTRAGEDFINARKPIYCQTKQTFKIKYNQKGKQSYKTNKFEGKKIHTGIYMYRKVH